MSGERDSAHGTLFVVGTPIGNLDDLSPRARDVLGRVDAIAAEDTRRTGVLLSRIGVHSELIAFHDHNERQMTGLLVERLLQGEDLALVSDAGMPLISDPGWRLVAAALEHGVEVRSVPGPSALTAALSVSGLATDRFVFEGFLPRQRNARRERLALLSEETRTLVFYESVHRLEASLASMVEAFGPDRRAAILRELTKLHEASYVGSLAELSAQVGKALPLRGEFVIVVSGAEHETSASDAEVRRVYGVLSAELPARQAVALTAAVTGVRRNAVYGLVRGQRREAE